MAYAPADRPTYTDEQMSKYLEWIGLPDLETVRSQVQDNPLRMLEKLQRRQLGTVVFSSIGLHYSQFHGLSLETDALYTKIVDRHFGGYCMENNTFFGTVLRSLGYNLYSTGGRVSNVIDAANGSDPEGFKGWNHMVNLVLIDGIKYQVDVGFGSQGPTSPSPLEEGIIVKNVPTSESRLSYRPLAQNIDKTQKFWVYEIRDAPDNPWKPAYCFSEVEFIPQDFLAMNNYTSTSRTSMFTYNLFLQQILMDDNDEPIGNLVLRGNQVSKRLHGKNEVVATFESEQERVKGLEKWFDIVLRPEEIRGIHGMVSALRV